MHFVLSRTAASALALALFLAFSGCTQTRVLTLSSQDSRDEINLRTAGRTATLVLRDGFQQKVEGIHIAPDLTSWIDPESTNLRSAPTDDVVAVRFIRSGHGALLGFGVGCALAAVIGTGIFYATSDTSDQRASALLGGPLVFGPMGGIVGGIGGFARGSRTVYRTSSGANN